MENFIFCAVRSSPGDYIWHSTNNLPNNLSQTFILISIFQLSPDTDLTLRIFSHCSIIYALY